MAGKADPREAHERVVDVMRQEHEKRTGHTPTDTEQRGIEQRADRIAHRHYKKKEK